MEKPENYDKKFAFQFRRDGEKGTHTGYADTLAEIRARDAEPGVKVIEVEDGFFAYEKENNYRLAWRSRGRVRRGLWDAEYVKRWEKLRASKAKEPAGGRRSAPS